MERWEDFLPQLVIVFILGLVILVFTVVLGSFLSRPQLSTEIVGRGGSEPPLGTLEATPTSTSTVTPTPTSTVTQTPTVTPTITPTPTAAPPMPKVASAYGLPGFDDKAKELFTRHVEAMKGVATLKVSYRAVDNRQPEVLQLWEDEFARPDKWRQTLGLQKGDGKREDLEVRIYLGDLLYQRSLARNTPWEVTRTKRFAFPEETFSYTLPGLMVPGLWAGTEPEKARVVSLGRASAGGKEFDVVAWNFKQGSEIWDYQVWIDPTTALVWRRTTQAKGSDGQLVRTELAELTYNEPLDIALTGTGR